jgi:NADH-quinone oxidoreductase subunit B
MSIDQSNENFEHPLFDFMEKMPGLDIAMTTADKLLSWSSTNSLFVFPMATSCCGIEFMAAACGRFDLDRIGTIARGTPRQCDVMVIAGTITVKMAPRVKKLWDMMPEPKWAIAMGSCAISGDFYRNIYSVVPGVDTFMPVDVYVPGCPPNPDHLLQGFKRLQEKIKAKRSGEWVEPESRPVTGMQMPSVPRYGSGRDPAYDQAQLIATQNMGLGGDLLRAGVTLPQPAPPPVDDDTPADSDDEGAQ